MTDIKFTVVVGVRIIIVHWCGCTMWQMRCALGKATNTHWGRLVFQNKSQAWNWGIVYKQINDYIVGIEGCKFEIMQGCLATGLEVFKEEVAKAHADILNITVEAARAVIFYVRQDSSRLINSFAALQYQLTFTRMTNHFHKSEMPYAAVAMEEVFVESTSFPGLLILPWWAWDVKLIDNSSAYGTCTETILFLWPLNQQYGVEFWSLWRTL